MEARLDNRSRRMPGRMMSAGEREPLKSALPSSMSRASQAGQAAQGCICGRYCNLAALNEAFASRLQNPMFHSA